MNVINQYYLLDSSETKEYNLERFKECDFNIIQNDKNPKYGSNIPLTLKEKIDPYLILFYYNQTDIQILKDWEQASEKTEFGEYLEEIGENTDREELPLSEVSDSRITKFLEETGEIQDSAITDGKITEGNVNKFIETINDEYDKINNFFNKRKQEIKSSRNNILSPDAKEKFRENFRSLLSREQLDEYNKEISQLNGRDLNNKEKKEETEKYKEVFIQNFEREFIQKYRNYNLLCNNDICKYIIAVILYFTKNKEFVTGSETHNFREEYKEYFPKSDTNKDLFFNFVRRGIYKDNKVIKTIYQLNSSIKVFEKLKEFFFREFRVNIEEKFISKIKEFISLKIKNFADTEIKITDDELNELIKEKIEGVGIRSKKNKFLNNYTFKTIKKWIKEKYGYTNVTGLYRYPVGRLLLAGDKILEDDKTIKDISGSGTPDLDNLTLSYKNPKLIKLERTLRTLESRPITEDTVRNCLICLYKTYLVISEKIGRKLDPVLQRDVPDDYQVPDDWKPRNGKQNWEWEYNTARQASDDNIKRSKLYTQFKELKERRKEEERERSRRTNIENFEREIKFGFVNLSLETKLLKSFKEVPRSNPFRWAQIKDTEQNYFILFYYGMFPQFFYDDMLYSSVIYNRLSNWREMLKETETYKGTKFRKINNRFVGDDVFYSVIHDRGMIDKEGDIFEFKKGEVYKSTNDNDNNYEMINQLDQEKVYLGKIYGFNQFFKEVKTDKNKKEKKEKREVILDTEFFSNPDNQDFTDLFNQIKG